MSDNHIEFPIFRGLQRPLEFMGLQGRYIGWAAITAMSSLLGFIITYFISSLLWSLMMLLAILAVGAVTIMIKMQKGLHTKQNTKGIIIYAQNKSL